MPRSAISLLSGDKYRFQTSAALRGEQDCYLISGWGTLRVGGGFSFVLEGVGFGFFGLWNLDKWVVRFGNQPLEHWGILSSGLPTHDQQLQSDRFSWHLAAIVHKAVASRSTASAPTHSSN